MKIPNLLVIISLISFSQYNFDHWFSFYKLYKFFLKITTIKFPSIYVQENGRGDIFEDDDDGGGDGGGVEDNDVGNEEINENTNDFSPSSFGSPTNPNDEVNQTEQQQAFGANVEQK